MTNRSGLLAGVAILAALTAGVAPAAAAAKHHKARISGPSELQLLKAEVAELKARLDAQEEAQRSTQAQADVAQTQAAAAVVQAQASQTQAATTAASVPMQIAAVEAKIPKPQPVSSGSTVISGRMYFNASNIEQRSNGAKTAADGTGFNIKRFYLGVDHQFNDVFSGNITTDISNVIGSTSNGNFATGSNSLDGRGLYIKKAYLQAKISPALIIRAGAADMPWIPYDEGIYGYRHVELTLIDRTSFGTSADWGIHVLGDLAHGILSYQVSVVDGGGYRNVKVTKSVDVEGRLSASYKGLFAAVGGYTGKLGNNVEGTPVYRTASRFDALGGYKNKLLTIGAEYFSTKNYTTNGITYVTSATVSDKAEGYSVFGSVNFLPKMSVFGRYDWVKPRETGAEALRDHYYNVGVQWSPVKIVDLGIVYKRDNVDNGSFATANGTIGGTNSTTDGTYKEIGLFGQFRF